MFRICHKENLLVKENSDGSIQLLKYEEIIKKMGEELFYVENGLERYCSATGENDDKPKKIESLLECHILPIISDPTNKDGDGDGILDINEKWNGIDERYKNISPLKADTIETLYPELKIRGVNDDSRRVFVKTKDNTITLNVRISKHLKQEEKNWIKQALNQYWAGEYKGNIYDFYDGMTVSVKINLIESISTNCINVFFEKTSDISKRSYTRSIFANKPVRIYYTGNEPELSTIAHEFGHVFGLDDAYLELDPEQFRYSLSSNYGLMPYNFINGECEVEPINEMMICNKKVYANDIEMILEAKSKYSEQHFIHGTLSPVSKAIKSPYLLYLSPNYELYYYDNSSNTVNKVMKVINNNLYESEEYTELYQYGKEYFSFLLTYKNWVDSFYPQYSVGLIELHEYLTNNFVIDRYKIDSIYKMPDVHYRRAFKKGDIVSVGVPCYTVYDAVSVLQDGYSVWAENDTYLNELLKEGEKCGMKYMEEHEFTFMGNVLWGPCDNKSHIHVTFSNDGYYIQDLCIYIGKDDIYEFETF